MATETIEDVFQQPFTFTARPRSIPCDLRLVWRLHSLVLLLDACRGQKASHQQLHVLNWASRNEESRRSFIDFLNGNRTPNQIIVRYDPSLNRAVHFAFAEGVIERQAAQDPDRDAERTVPPYRILLTEKGRALLAQTQDMDDCFTTLKQFLIELPGKIGQKQIELLFSWEFS